MRSDKENGKPRLVYRVVGEGTEEFSQSDEQETSLEIIGPLGNGFPLKGEKASSYGWRNRCAAYGRAGERH